jgi:hypothetical protein
MNNDYNEPFDPNYDPYEISPEQEYEENVFENFDARRYGRRRGGTDSNTQPMSTEPIPTPRRGRASPPSFPQDPNADAPQYPEPNPAPGAPGGDFDTFNPDAYLQQRYRTRGGYVDPNQAVPLQGFEAPIPDTRERPGGQAALARSRTLRTEWDIMRDGEPLVRLGVVAFFILVGGLLSLCWISNIVMLFWYTRR